MPTVTWVLEKAESELQQKLGCSCILPRVLYPHVQVSPSGLGCHMKWRPCMWGLLRIRGLLKSPRACCLPDHPSGRADRHSPGN